MAGVIMTHTPRALDGAMKRGVTAKTDSGPLRPIYEGRINLEVLDVRDGVVVACVRLAKILLGTLNFRVEADADGQPCYVAYVEDNADFYGPDFPDVVGGAA